MPVSVLTQHNDNIRSGANLQETKLNTTNVNVNDFGLVASHDVEGQIYAQPLYVPGIEIAGKARNVVYVVTMHNWVYAFDADDLSLGAGPLWKRQVDPHPVPSGFYRLSYHDISNNTNDPIGILSTPVVDLTANVIYLVAATFDPAILAGPVAAAPYAFKQLLFALDLSTGKLRSAVAESSNPVTFGGSLAGVGYGDGRGNVYFGSGNGDSDLTAVGGPNLGQSFVRLRASATSLDLDAYRKIIQDPGVPDEDLGAASPTILPDGFLVGGGKDGNFYLLDPAQMTKTNAAASLVQAFLATRGRGSRPEKPLSTHHIHGSPVVYDSPNQGVLVYVWGENEVLRNFQYDPISHGFSGQPNARNVPGQSRAIGTMYASNDERDRDGMPGAMLSLSANGKIPGTANLWASLPPFLNANHGSVDGILTAYDATQFDAQGRLVQLWHSHQNPADDPGNFAKFCCPTVADGKVFLAI